ncbi:MAG: hypothetical protein OZ921_02340 [Sorangiineae bacterium]|nr:hypothetical protein [Polyangiaceae bacterium]MEB2321324.1 hypothetical protein [Sorangiineae bacterium]
MYVVALTRWAEGPREPELAALAPLLGRNAYDARLVLAGPLPLVIARTDDRDRATDALARLRARGHGAVACDETAVVSSSAMFAPRDFSFDAAPRAPPVLVVSAPARGERRLRAERALALVCATHDGDAEQTIETRTRKLSLGRAALTGGLSFSKAVVNREHRESSERERVLYLFHHDGAEPIFFCESRLRYGGLGARVAPTTIENFRRLLEALRAWAPGTLYSEHLLAARRRAEISSLSAGAVARSNAGETDLAAHLVALAHRSGQL